MNWEVRQYQQDAVAACLAGFSGRGCASVMLESPVGSGKTYMALRRSMRCRNSWGASSRSIGSRRAVICSDR